MRSTHIISRGFNYNISRFTLSRFFLTTSLSSSRNRHLLYMLNILDNRTFGHGITSLVMSYSCASTEPLISPTNCSLQQAGEQNGACSAFLSTSDSEKKKRTNQLPHYETKLLLFPCIWVVILSWKLTAFPTFWRKQVKRWQRWALK